MREPKEYPILFSAPMILRLLVNEKHVTRRLDPQWLKVKAGDRLWCRETWATPEKDRARPGRVAYNADGLCGAFIGDGGGGLDFICHGRVHQADGYRQCFPAGGAATCNLAKYTDIRHGEYPSYRYGWRPSIHMPRWASRILLECTEDARMEPLHDLTDEEAVLEGCPGSPDWTPSMEFAALWGKLHAEPGTTWKCNPDVVRVGRFERVK